MKLLHFYLVVILFFASAVQAATPFDAPANFDLSGSSVSFSVTFDTIRGGTVSGTLNPNPAPVTGNIYFSSLQKNSGVFNGQFQNVSGSTTLSNIPGLSSIDVSVSINSSTNGMFIWSQDKVVFNAENLTATFTIGDQQFPVNLKGIVIPASYNNDTISLQLSFSKTDSYNNLGFSISADINLAGNRQTATGTPWIGLSSPSTIYKANDTFDLFVSLGSTSSTSIPVDLYIALLKPNGDMLLLSSDLTFTSDIVPIVSNFTISPDTLITNQRIFQELLPAVSPPIDTAGVYKFYSLFTQPGSFDAIGEVNELLAFNYSLDSSGSYDGTYIGTALNSTPSEQCSPSIASLIFTIKQNQLSGTAEEEVNGATDTDGYTVTGSIDANGAISNGVIWEEYMTSIVPIGSFEGSIANNVISGTWNDSYGCYGSYSLSLSK